MCVCSNYLISCCGDCVAPSELIKFVLCIVWRFISALRSKWPVEQEERARFVIDVHTAPFMHTYVYSHFFLNSCSFGFETSCAQRYGLTACVCPRLPFVVCAQNMPTRSLESRCEFKSKKKISKTYMRDRAYKGLLLTRSYSIHICLGVENHLADHGITVFACLWLRRAYVAHIFKPIIAVCDVLI